ncbi:MAG TPA: hypothetical protein VNF48_08095 [Gammaproteobacteria bacterium]|nr:hypothetical protein [Gammaproteobacteria bacterium]
MGIASANNVILINSKATALGPSTISGTLSVTSNGALTQTGILAVTGAASFQQNSTGAVATQNITLNSFANNAAGTVTFTTGAGAGINNLLWRNSNAAPGALFLPASISGNLTLTYDNAPIILPGISIGGALAVTANGAIGQSGALIVAGTSTLAAGAANNITLNDASNDFVGAVGITNGNNVSLTDVNSLILAASTVSGTLNINAGGSVTQTGAITANTLTGTLTGAASAFILNTINNRITNLGISAGAGITAPGGFFLTNGNNWVNVNGVMTTTNSPITINAGTGAFQMLSATSAFITGSGAITTTSNLIGISSTVAAGAFQTTGAVTLQPFSAGTTMSLAGGGGTFNLQPSEIAEAVKGIIGAGSITIGTPGFSTGLMTIAGTINFGSITASIYAGSFTDGGNIRVITAKNLNLTANNVGGAIGAAGGNNPIDVAVTNLTINTNNGDAFITSTGGFNFGIGATVNNVGTGQLDLNVTAGGSITQTTSITANTLTATLVGGSSALNLNGALNNITNLGTASTGITAPGGFTLNDGINPLNVINAVSTAGGAAITINAGSITESGAGLFSTTGLLTTTTQTGQALIGANTIGSFNATNISSGNIALTNTANPLNITGIANIGGGGITINNTGAINITGAIAAGSSAAINLTASGAAGSITESGSGIINTAGTTTLTANAGNDITMSGANDFGSVTVVSGRNVVLNDVNAIQFSGASVISGTLSVTAVGITEAVGGTLAVIGASTLNAGAGIITLGNANAFTGAVTLINSGNNNVTLNNGTNLLTLGGASSVGSGSLTLTSVGITEAGAATITQAASAGIVTITAGAGAINLGGNNNFTGSVSLSNSGAFAATLSNVGNLTLGTVNVGNSLVVTSTTGSLILNGTVTATGGNSTFNAATDMAVNAGITATGRTVALNIGTAGAGGSLTFGIINIGATTLNVTGGAGNDSFDLHGLTTSATTFTVNGGAGSNSLTGNNAGDQFNITGANAGNITGLVTSFTNIQNLTGGSGNDSFTLASGVLSFNGSITGGGGVDTLAATDGTNAWAITGANAGTLNTTTVFSGISNFTGGSGNDIFTLSGTGHISGLISGGGGIDTLVGNNLVNSWLINAANTGILTDAHGSNAFTGIANLTGGTSNDTFTLASGVPTFNGSIAGGGGVDTLAATDGTNAWAITGANAGSLNTTTVFSGISNLTGGSGDDDFVFSDGQGVTGTVDGGAGGNNILDFSAYSTAVGITLTGSNPFGYSGTTSGVPNPTGGFAEITQIDEPALSNTLTLANGIATSVTINSSIAVNLFDLTVNVSGAPNLVFTNISTVNGGSGAINTLISGEGTNNTWTLTGANGGSYNDGQLLIFTHFADLVGGTGNDMFILASSGSVINIDGGAGVNTLTGNNAGDAFNITAADAGNITGLVTSFTNIQNLSGGTGNDTFTLASGVLTFNGSITGSGGVDTVAATDGNNAWAITGANAGTLNTTTVFSGISNLTGGSGNDRFIFITGGSVSGNLIGGGGTDALDYSGLSGPVSLILTSVSGSLGTGTGSLIGGTFSGMSVLKGSASALDMLIGPNQANVWQITSADAGTVDGFQFSSIENLTGGSGTNQFVLNGGNLSGNINGGSGSAVGNSLQGNNISNIWNVYGANQGTVTGIAGGFTNIGNLVGGNGADTFMFANGASLAGTLDGGGTISGNDTIDWSGYITARNVILTGTGSIDGMQGTETSITGGFDNITNVIGANGTAGLLNNITGPNTVNTWNVTNNNGGNLNSALNFSNFQILTGGSGIDTFNLSAGVSGSINGGAGNDIVNIVSSFTAPAPTLAINNVEIINDNAAATITAATLSISGATSVGSAGKPLLTNIAALQITGSNGDAFINNFGNLDLQVVAIGSGAFTLVSGGNVTDTSGQNVTAGSVNIEAVSGIGASGAPIKIVTGNLSAAVSGAGNMYFSNTGAITLGAISTAGGDIEISSSGTLIANGPINTGGNGNITLTTSGGDLTTTGIITANGSGNVNLNAAGFLNLDSAISSGTGILLLTGGSGVTGNSHGSLTGTVVDVTAASGDIFFTDVTSSAAGGTTLLAPGNITLQGFTTTKGALTILNGGTFAVTGPVSLSTTLNQTGAGPVSLSSSITSSGGSVQFASPVTVNGSANIATNGGNIIFNQAITGASGSASMILDSGAGNISLQTVTNLGTLSLTTSGTLLLDSDITAGTLLATAVTGGVVIGGSNVHINTVNSDVDFSNATGIDGVATGSQSLTINAGSGNVNLSRVGQITPLASLTIDGGTIALADVTTTNAQSYAGNVQLHGNLTSTVGGGVQLNGNLSLLSDAAISAAGAGNILVSGNLDGAHALTLTTPSGQISLNGVVGGTIALTSLTVNSAVADLKSVTTSGNQAYRTGTTNLAGVLNSKAGAISFSGVLNIAAASTIQADAIGFNGGASSVRGNSTLTLLPETKDLTVNLGGSGSGLTLNNIAMNGYNGELYIGTGPGPGNGLYITNPVAVLAGNVNVNGSLTLGSSGTLLIAGMGNLTLNSGTLTANSITLIAGSQNSLMLNPGTTQTLIQANTVILVSGGQIGNLGQELNIATTGSNPQVQIATGALQVFLSPPNLPIAIAPQPQAKTAYDIAIQLGLFIQGDTIVTSIGQQIAALSENGGLLESGFVDISLFQNISLYDVYGLGIALPVDQCERLNNQSCN